MTPPARRCALSVAGLDPSGGAGVLADARAFVAAGAWPCAIVAVNTVQSTAGMASAMAVDAATVRAQADALFANQDVAAWKAGALGGVANIEVVRALRAAHPTVPFVVDPVLAPTRGGDGARLTDVDALDALRSLLAAATLVTPNVPEAETLLGKTIRGVEDSVAAACAMVDEGASAVLLKGGHLTGPTVTDVFATRAGAVLLEGPRLPVPGDFHGGGCTLSALITGRLAAGAAPMDDASLLDAVRWARARMERAIARRVRVGVGLAVLPLDEELR